MNSTRKQFKNIQQQYTKYQREFHIQINRNKIMTAIEAKFKFQFIGKLILILMLNVFILLTSFQLFLNACSFIRGIYL